MEIRRLSQRSESVVGIVHDFRKTHKIVRRKFSNKNIKYVSSTSIRKLVGF
jgi:hypothetical protein